jgi:threonine/homoserine/homoserine lactone efflux protein
MIAGLEAFLALSLVVIITPGPDTALTVRNALVGGRSGGIATAAGVAAGQTTWALFTALGIAALVRASQPAFLAVRVAGVGYLIFLGVQGLLAARRGPTAHASSHRRLRRLVAARAFRQGLFSDLSNPKMVVFFISLLPQFSTHGSFAALMTLGLIFSALTFLWLTGYALVVARAGDFLRRGRVRRVLDALTGVALVALGARLALERPA